MTHKDVLKLAEDINKATHGDFLIDYSIGGRAHTNFVTIINTTTQLEVISGPAATVYSYLLAFYRGMSYGLRQANKLFDKHKVNVESKLAQLLHTKECREDELEDKEVGDE